MYFFFFFFFSSRRRHTRSLRDWSSDVCSSDLLPDVPAGSGGAPAHSRRFLWYLPQLRRRSEERRVGKECRSRWSRGQGKKKKSEGEGDGCSGDQRRCWGW